MPGHANPVKTALLFVWSVILFFLSVIFSGPTLLVLRRAVGAMPFWLLGLGFSLLMWGGGFHYLAVLFLGIIVLIGVYYECDKRQKGLLFSAVSAVFTAFAIEAGACAAWILRTGPQWYPQVLDKTNDVIHKFFAASGSEVPLKAKDLIIQFPSAMFMLLLFTLFIALLFEPRVSRWMGWTPSQKYRLSNFKAPEHLIWLFIVALLGSFLKTPYTWVQDVAVNFLNVTVVIYFFQGLSVVVRFFEVYKVGQLWRAILLFIFIVQLFLVVSFVGLVDYWVDFRGRLIKKTAQANKTS